MKHMQSIQRRAAAILAVAGGLSGLASAQSLAVTNGVVLATDTDLAPGCGGATFGGSFFTDAMSTGLGGNVLFRGRLTGAGVAPIKERAYFYGSTRAGLTLVMRGNDPEPSGTIPFATLNSATAQGLGGTPRLTESGMMLFGATMSGGTGMTTANDTALFTGTPGSFSILVREGDATPGGGGSPHPTRSSAACCRGAAA